LHMAQQMPLPLTVSCFSKIQIGFTFLVPAHPGSPTKRAVKRVYVCVCVCDDLTPENALCLDVYCDAYLTCCLCYTLAKYKQIGVKYTPCSNKKTTLYFARYPGTRSYHNAATSHGSVRASIIHRLTCVKFHPVRRGGGRGRGRTGQVGRDITRLYGT